MSVPIDLHAGRQFTGRLWLGLRLHDFGSGGNRLDADRTKALRLLVGGARHGTRIAMLVGHDPFLPLKTLV